MYSILYVDDEEDLLALGRIFLEAYHSFAVTTVRSAPEALDRLATAVFDAVVADYQMPTMDGIRLLREVRLRYGDLPFILFTGKGREEIVIEAIDNGVDFFLQKGGDSTAQYAELAHKLNIAVERKRAKDAVQKLTRQNEEALRTACMGHWEFDAVAGLFLFNDQYYTLHGVTAAEAGGYRISAEDFARRFVHPDEAPGIREAIDAALATGDPGFQRRFESRILRAGGEPRDITVWFRIEKDGAGRTTTLHGVSQDITDRKRAEGERALFKDSADRASDQVFWMDRAGKILYVNGSACRDTGFLRDELLAMTVFNLYPAVTPARWEAFVQELRQGTTRLFSSQRRNRNGTFSDVEIMANHVARAGAEYIFSYARDITARKKAEEELRRIEARYRIILQSANDAILIHLIVDDRPERLLEVNDQACRMLGYTREELLSMGIADIDAPEQAARVPAIQMRLNGTGSVIFRTDHLTKDGRRIPVEVNARLIDLDGRPAVVSIVRDLSELKRTEHEVIETNRKLMLLSSVTRHDIRNNLTVLGLDLGLLRAGLSDPELHGCTGRMESVMRRIGQQIEFTRIYQDLGTSDPVWQDIGPLIASLAVPASLALEADVRGMSVLADPILPMVFSNLLDNTLRHGGNPTAARVTAGRDHDGMVITWQDNGRGIPLPEKAKIFVQGYGSNTGLGLFLCREILAITDITIAETGEPGKGACFRMVVPEGKYRMQGPAGSPG